MVCEQGKKACTRRRSMAFRAASAEGSGVRLRVLLTACKIAPMDFAQFTKVSPQRLNNWFSRGIPHSQLDRIARQLSVNVDWLKTGVGEKFPATSE